MLLPPKNWGESTVLSSKCALPVYWWLKKTIHVQNQNAKKKMNDADSLVSTSQYFLWFKAGIVVKVI